MTRIRNVALPDCRPAGNPQAYHIPGPVRNPGRKFGKKTHSVRLTSVRSDATLQVHTSQGLHPVPRPIGMSVAGIYEKERK